MKTNSQLFIIIFILFFFDAFGQPELARLQNYWNYRDRYKKWFVKIGPDYGEGIPVSRRNIRDSDPSLIHQLYFGDVTASLGDYIAVLATEYKLLQNAGQPTTATLNELYYAINAVYRLDAFAEPHFDINWPPTQNGFFIRDDVRGNFHQNWQSFYPKSGEPLDDMRSTASDFVSGTIKDAEMSQDQIIGLFLGFAFVKKLVDPIIVQPTVNDPPRNLVASVELLTDLIMQQIISTKNNISIVDVKIAGTLYPLIYGDKDWVIANPVTGDHVFRGADVTGFLYPLAKCAEFINGNNYESDVDVYFNNTFPFNICPVHFSVESFKLRDLWIDVPSHLGPGFTVSSPFNAVCLEGSVCIAPFLQTPTPLCIPNSPLLELMNGTLTAKEFNINMMLSLAASASLSSQHWSQNQIQQISNEHLMPIFDLVYSILQGTPPLNPKSDYELLLDFASFSNPNNGLCYGPYNYGGGDHSPYY